LLLVGRESDIRNDWRREAGKHLAAGAKIALAEMGAFLDIRERERQGCEFVMRHPAFS